MSNDIEMDFGTADAPPGSLERVVSRSAFEAWISAPPYERSTHRWPDDGTKAWPGQYSDYPVELAWEAWKAAANLQDQARASDHRQL